MPRSFELIWGGDVNIGRRLHGLVEDGDFARVLDLPRLREADLRLFNLECVVSLKGEQGRDKGEGGPFYFRARPEMLGILQAAGCDVVACANNHSGDYGPEAVLDQRDWLEAWGIAAVGTGANSTEAFRPVFRRVAGQVLAIFSVDSTQASFAAGPDRPGGAYLRLSDPDSWSTTFAPLIKAAREKADHVVVAVHWGPNGAAEPGADEIAVGHRLIEAGADAVLGASAHNLQGIEIYQGRPILHDAGNLLFDSLGDGLQQGRVPGGLFGLRFGAAGVERVAFVPTLVGCGFTRQCEGEAAQQATAAFAQLCAGLGTQLQVDAQGHGYVDLCPAPRKRPALAGTAVDHVPLDARITPIEIGPLRLIGLRFGPRQMPRRQMLWVESFWDCTAPPDADWRISFTAMPLAPSKMPAWGRAMDHDPCDWRLPTRQWQPGVIYRDHYGLRPPPIRVMENVELGLHVQLIGPNGPTPRIRLPHLALPFLRDKGKPRFSKVDPSYRDVALPKIAAQAAKLGQTWTAAELAQVTGGQWLVPPPEGWHVRSVVNGSKHIAMRPGPHLFVAHDSFDRVRHESKVPGRNIDRHLQIAGLRERIAGVIVSRPMAGDLADLPQLLVQDPIRAHIELGIAARSRFEGEVFGVTGTVGKSSVSRMLTGMLGGGPEVVTSVDNYNTRVGAPITLASLGLASRAAVIEMAQSGLWMQRGPVSRLVRPTVALVTALGLSQTAKGVSSLADVARYKSKVFDGLTGRAVAVVGEHLPCRELVLAEAQKHAKRVFTYGPSAAADLRVLGITPSLLGSHVALQFGARHMAFELPLLGHGMALNAVAALACIAAVEGDLDAAIASLADLTTGEACLERFELRLPSGVVEVIDDSWNAEVVSMEHALSVLASRPISAPGRRIAVLGRIVHLGEMGRSLHMGLAAPVLASGAQLVLTHGPEMLWLRAQLPEALLGPHFDSAEALADHLLERLRPGDTVMVKGSRRDSDFGELCPLLRRKTAPQPNLS